MESTIGKAYTKLADDIIMEVLQSVWIDSKDGTEVKISECYTLSVPDETREKVTQMIWDWV